MFMVGLNAKGVDEVDWVHYDSNNISSLVTNESTIRIIMVLNIIFEGAFLCSKLRESFKHESARMIWKVSSQWVIISFTIKID